MIDQSSPLHALVGSSYPITVDPNFGSKDPTSDSYISLRYNLKSDLLDDSHALKMTRSSSASYIVEDTSAPSSINSKKQSNRTFRAQPSPTQEQECVLLYDPATQTFTIHQLSAVLRLSVSRGSKELSAEDPPQPPPPVQIPSAEDLAPVPAGPKKKQKDASSSTPRKKKQTSSAGKKQKKDDQNQLETPGARVPALILPDSQPRLPSAPRLPSPLQSSTSQDFSSITSAPQTTPALAPPIHIPDDDDDSDIEGLDELANALEDSLEEDSDSDPKRPPPAPATAASPIKPQLAPRISHTSDDDDDDDDDDDPYTTRNTNGMDLDDDDDDDDDEDEEMPSAVTIVETASAPPIAPPRNTFDCVDRAPSSGPISLKGFVSSNRARNQEEELLSSSDEE